jgi:hypothetical protein
MNYLSNILSVYNRASKEDISDGLEWYDVALKECQDISERYELPLNTVIGVMAALSPNNRWNINVKNTNQMCAAFVNGDSVESCIVSTYKTMRAKAWSILEDVLIEHDEILNRLNGKKIRSFYSNIAGLDEVTIDGHALNIARGERVELTNNKTSIGVKLYKELQECYIEAARQAGIEPRQMQAITWTTWRREHGIA